MVLSPQVLTKQLQPRRLSYPAEALVLVPQVLCCPLAQLIPVGCDLHQLTVVAGHAVIKLGGGV
jgi:hypothetical protein